MVKSKKTAALILAAGNSSRFGNTIPKQFYEIGGKKIIEYSLEAAEINPKIDNTFIVANKGYIEICESFMRKYPKTVKVITGGSTRQESVFLGLDALRGRGFLKVIIHDSARPFCGDVMDIVILSLEENKTAVPCLPLQDTLYYLENEKVKEIPERSKFFYVQTPQGFYFEDILPAHEFFYKKGYLEFPDDGSLLFAVGKKINCVKGDKKNFKITTQSDLDFAEYIIERGKENG